TAVPNGFHQIEDRRFSDTLNDLQRTLNDAGFKSVGPRYLPDGFSIIGADFGTFRPSVTQFEGHDAEYVKDGPTTLLSWREHGLAFALVGDLDLRELIEIAMSVVP